MPAFTFTLLSPDGSIDTEREAECPDERSAVGWAGRLDHPHEILVRRGSQIVARFTRDGAVHRWVA